VTISFAHPAGDGEFYRDALSAFADEYPRITVQLQPTSMGEFERMAQATKADTFVVYPQTQLAELLEDGMLLDLAPLIEQDGTFDLSDLYPNALEQCTIDGRRWAIPAGIDVVVLFYNQGLFDRSHVPHPEIGWTWAEFLHTARALLNPDDEVYAYLADPFLAVLAVYQHGGQIVDDLRHPTRTTFDDPLTIEAVQWYADLVQVHDVAPPPSALLSPVDGWVEEKVAMMAMSIDQRDETKRVGWSGEWPAQWGMVPLPGDARSATMALVEGYAISAQAAHPEACWQWIAFLSEQVAPASVPARRSVVESDAYRERVGAQTADVVQAIMEDAQLVYLRDRELLQVFVGAVAQVLKGEATAAGAMQWAQEQSPLQ
jgi:multiple sugar transport system substrate-binding protein